MSKPNIIYSNKNATNYSFLYFLHEEDRFDEKSFYDLYAYGRKSKHNKLYGGLYRE